ncbi:MAG: DUF4848 domain-containing protein [Dysgonomonas sp.]|uniref:DUF4848 domain-containing protein n=1 Tax=Dysgonomonas sp. TaxID=1891233 RepID=UPI003A8A500E
MKKIALYFAVCVLVTLPYSCDRNEEIAVEQNQSENIPDVLTGKKKGISVVVLPDTGKTKKAALPEQVLRFDDECVFSESYKELESLSKSEQIGWAKVFDHLSAAEIYSMAMEEAANLDFTHSQYFAFKKKYGDYLYFPEYQEDYGAYLPYKDAAIASIANKNGRYMIGDKVIQADQITTYDQLQDAGMAYYPPKYPYYVIKPAYTTNTKTTVTAYPLGELGTSSYLTLGKGEYSFDSGWMIVNDGKKLKVELRRVLKSGKGYDDKYNEILWQSEVSFRKKGLFGFWYNYSSETVFMASITYSDGTTQAFSHRGNGASSHDGWYSCPWDRITPNGNYIVKNVYTGSEVPESGYPYYPRKLYHFKGFTAQMSVTYRGMDGTRFFTCIKPELWAYSTAYNWVNK